MGQKQRNTTQKQIRSDTSQNQKQRPSTASTAFDACKKQMWIYKHQFRLYTPTMQWYLSLHFNDITISLNVR